MIAISDLYQFFVLYSQSLCCLDILLPYYHVLDFFSNWGMYMYFLHMFSGFGTKQVSQMNMCHLLSQVLVKTDAVFFIVFKPN